MSENVPTPDGEPIQVPIDSAIDTGAEVPQPPEQGEQPETPPDRSAIDKLATEYGFEPADFAAYPDEASAKAALRSYLDNMARLGTSGGAAPVQQQQPPQMATVPQPGQHFMAARAEGQRLWELKPEDFGLDADDPAYKAVAAYDQRMQQVIGALAGHVQQTQQSHQETARQSLRSEINSTVDKFASTEFGTGDNVSRFQELNRERLFNIAGSIAAGYQHTGRDVPPARQLLSLAKFQYEQEKGIVSAPAPPKPSAQNTPTLAGRSPSAGGNLPQQPGGLIKPFREDPAVQAFLRGL